MVIREILVQEKDMYDLVVKHPLQSWAWGEFKKATGVEVFRLGAFDGPKLVAGFQFTIHKVPQLGWKIGYIAKSYPPDDAFMYAVRTAVRQYNLVSVKIEANMYAPANQAEILLKPARDYLTANDCKPGKALFTPHSFVLDLGANETVLLSNMKPKTRYNIKVAEKHGVQISIDDSKECFDEYIHLWKETTKRQEFYSHDQKYHQDMWKFLGQAKIAHLMKATHQGKTLAIWVLFLFNRMLYYPYGASSREAREVMASNLLAWEAIKFGQANYCHQFDMWGSLGPNPDPNNPWHGFHKFKEGYGGQLVEFLGTYDYIADPQRYLVFTKLDEWRWKLLRFRSKLPF